MKWSQWIVMPCPKNCREIKGPKEYGVYQIRNKQTKAFMQFGIGKQCQKRMKSLFPKPYGTGTRNNESKRKYILANWKTLEYRTISVNSKEEAVLIENKLKFKENHLFNT